MLRGDPPGKSSFMKRFITFCFLAAAFAPRLVLAEWVCPAGQPGDCNAWKWGSIHHLEDLIGGDSNELQTIVTNIANCWSSYGVAKTEYENATIAFTKVQSMAATLSNEKDDLTTLKIKEDEFLKSVDKDEILIEQALPPLMLRIQNYIARAEESLDLIINNIDTQLENTPVGSELRNTLEFQLKILKGIQTAEAQTHNTKDQMVALLNTIAYGSDSERTKALFLFDPITQAVLQLSITGKDEATGVVAFAALKKEAVELSSWLSAKIQEIDSKIDESSNEAAKRSEVFQKAKASEDQLLAQCQTLDSRRVTLPGEIQSYQSQVADGKQWLDNQGCIKQFCQWVVTVPPPPSGPYFPMPGPFNPGGPGRL